MEHKTVLLNEAIKYLNIDKDKIYVDATLGGAGHSKEIIKLLDKGFLFCFDQDDYAINYAAEVLKNKSNYEIIKANFKNIKEELEDRGIKKVDGILFDLGMSSFQIDDIERGFSYMHDTTLDMRMNQNSSLTAEEIVNTYSADEIAKILYVYGEEKNSYKIANEIIKNRPLKTTFDLVEITDKINRKEKGHSAKKTFQALRIYVNDEMNVLEEAIQKASTLINKGGRIVIITFHSLEDRLVKHFFKKLSTVDIPKNLPIQGDIKGEFDLITRKPIYPSEEEQRNNTRSRSAKLRVIEKN